MKCLKLRERLKQEKEEISSLSPVFLFLGLTSFKALSSQLRATSFELYSPHEIHDSDSEAYFTGVSSS